MSEFDDGDASPHFVLLLVANHRKLLERLFADSAEIDAVLAEASQIAAAMIPDMAYSANPKHPMARSVYFCNASLAVFLAAKSRGVGVHQYGEQMLLEMRRTHQAPDATAEKPLEEQLAALVAASEDSLQEAAPGEFVFDVQISTDQETDWSMSVKSCAICASFSKYDAMDLVPYMCATDDIVSDAAGQGLRRTGTIALGARECDFKYRQGGAPRRVAQDYPERIRLREVQG